MRTTRPVSVKRLQKAGESMQR
ncbi:MAG TPA: hypothetical protein VGP12_08215 [Nitrosospira sp.]|nr:hypothetical protein [Nitrosospira sp.]